ncbi:YchJ family metal-binding protein [Vibrio mediterranei]|uniref:YchJ family metal-binding protein n=1 Tax=Vibrio mediterranei TaxID=689 RepID=UPI0022834FF2|nr:YchJ family metal-binding protein [Vibrio mediterranei]MCY9851297.1 YchJ family metal-binding protein [Vibrio mediterranei]
MTSCYCGNDAPFESCCLPIHQDVRKANKPEQLMRARFSAHKTKNVDFVVATYHPSCDAEAERSSIADSINSNWTKLKVTGTESGTNKHEGFVSFEAYLEEDGFEYCLTERSRFIFEDDQWYYIDGELDDSIPPRPLTTQALKVGRNDPCVCGSGKKYKKCCG